MGRLVPLNGNPPEPTPTQAANFTKGTLKSPANSVRYSNLPMDSIVAAIKADATIGPQLNEFKDTTSGPGEFVSNFIAYHVVWYREWWNGGIISKRPL